MLRNSPHSSGRPAEKWLKCMVEIRNQSHLTPYTSHLSPHTSHPTPHTSHLTPNINTPFPFETPHTSPLPYRWMSNELQVDVSTNAPHA